MACETIGRIFPIRKTTTQKGGVFSVATRESHFPGFHSEHASTHKLAVDTITLPKTTGDVCQMLSSSYKEETAVNRRCLKTIAESIRFLARQGIALRGDDDEKDSNFMQLLFLRASNDPELLLWLERKTNNYTSPDIQNELLKIMALRILRDISAAVQDVKFFTLMSDEVADISNKEQVAICLRFIDEEFEPHELFIGMHAVDSIEASVLVTVLKDVLIRLNLPIHNCRGQCYDGAANMAGRRNGVAAPITSEESRAIFTHCCGHSLNLAAADTINQNKLLQNTLDTTREMSKLIKLSPRRDAIFKKLKQELAPETPGFRTLCPTRWTVRTLSLESVMDNLVSTIRSCKSSGRWPLR